MITVNLTPRSASVAINPKTIKVESPIEVAKNFLSNLEQEVKQNPRKARKLNRLLLTTHSTCLSMFLLVTPTYAAPTTTGLDPEVTTTIIMLEITCAALAVAAAVVGLMIAGVWKMFFGNAQADSWTTNIYKGLGQVIIAPIAVSLIVGLATLLFSGLPAFQPIGEALTVWLRH